MKKFMWLSLLAASCFCLGMAAYAAQVSSLSGIGSVASNVKTNLTNIAYLITAGSYVAGMGIAVAAIAKFKAHKENPTQVPISQAIALLFISSALIFAPSVFKAAGGTLFGASATVGGVSGVIKLDETAGAA